jgi:hypothetical protein
VPGIEHDREWVVADTRHSPSQFISQRDYPIMATLTANFQQDGSLVLSDGEGDRLVIPQPEENALLKVKVWNHETIGLDAGDAASSWVSARLGMRPGQARLVRFHPKMRRDCNQLYAGEHGAHTYFADGYPVLVTSVASLADLNARMKRDPDSALPMNRFRPNIVIAGLPAWDEDHIDRINIAVVELRLVKPCVRCQVTTTDQSSGARLSDEPLNTLARFRNNPEFGGVTFGWNAIVTTPGQISVLDRVTVEYRF